MTLPLARWHINTNATNVETYPILSQDTIWNSFALADMEPHLHDYSQFAMASRMESDEYTICLILRHPIIGEVLSTLGKSEGVAAIIRLLTGKSIRRSKLL